MTSEIIHISIISDDIPNQECPAVFNIGIKGSGHFVRHNQTSKHKKHVKVNGGQQDPLASSEVSIFCLLSNSLKILKDAHTMTIT